MGKKTKANSFMEEDKENFDTTLYLSKESGEVAAAHRPGLNRNDFPADRHVFFNVNRPVDNVVPHGRIIGPVHHIDLHLDRT